ncbi:hypothetical protein HDU82_006476 [Entophlyctis luteolus]|nr:hypothetical protein HDU82_006476 [Entophlyctis luteolus]
MPDLAPRIQRDVAAQAQTWAAQKLATRTMRGVDSSGICRLDAKVDIRGPVEQEALDGETLKKATSHDFAKIFNGDALTNRPPRSLGSDAFGAARKSLLPPIGKPLFPVTTSDSGIELQQ